MSNNFNYGENEIEFLKRVDPALGAIINEIGLIEREVSSDLFTSLINSIISQQISTKAADTVRKRLLERVGEIRAETLNNASLEEIQRCGMSMRKANYIKDTAAKVFSGEFDIEQLYALPDEEVIKRLCELHGIGVWTAEMMLIFCMQRPNVMSWGDLGIHRGLRMLYGQERIDKKLFQQYKNRYSPHASVASLYLWAISSGANNLEDPAPKPIKKVK